MLWKLELDEEYFRIYDSKKMIAGYFDPDYGDIYPKENSEQIISSMLKNHDKISRGMIMVPLVKFGLFDRDLDTSLSDVHENIARVNVHLEKWNNVLSEINCKFHSVHISHTDQDMLTITFPILFSKPTPLQKEELIKELFPTLDLLQKRDLL
ncbi:hypothetical protein AAA799E16_01149 [Marine Group I thaumarchaeote SCGC AAA799-E16]|uniref:Uncharacterized protein n=5 Tax=Marine Group I TaxID=905826 RepID=A0A087S6J0_9ARCH|nr:hypothetical protein AAA799N04_00898 [Marine Group I thaumarchaeote SCGC AAA799-N04]KER06139.1 hypothetical protein AAA799E16_01149 [Marine Group I thaumarchaeote SCGC AAA799-E16]KFM15875.1 hypothetical protein AAA799D11_01033 [Marine Group I thaumarchaeote SCGC AAA799-D11]KFM17440.1 hypothetical protein SCCGRSA3_01908 [Marine Group I thaumarchaeote SCGC RSA3]KFM21344.1 hypothetical protein AAA799B03_01119 [Marine Group I thaumarchaeote SCGC AAA799-B03]